MEKSKGTGWKRPGRVCLALIMTLLICVSSVSVQAGSPGKVRPADVSSCMEISDLIADTWEEGYFSAMTVDADSGEVTVDGGKAGSVRDVLQKGRVLSLRKQGIEKENQGAVTVTKKQVRAYADALSKDGVYEIKKGLGGDYEITAPYQTRRIIVEDIVRGDVYGASRIIYNEELGETILQYETQKEAEEACENFQEIYGEAGCYPDMVCRVDDVPFSMPEEIILENTGVYSWGNDYMGMSELKTRAAGAAPVMVAILDTGIDRSNFLFASRNISSKSYNFVEGNKNVMDNHGHGTHVAGIIADATPDNVQIMMLKISNTSGYSSLLTIKTALQYALNKRVDVVNMSLGFVGVNASKCTYLDSLINRAYREGVAICTAAGNSGVDVNYCYPACNKKTLAISAIDSDEGFAYYSNRGSLVDFCAPGSQVISAAPGNGLIGMSGTSMSAPHVTAAVAYIKMIKKDMSVSGIYNELKARCRDLGAPGRDIYYGWGCPVMTGLFDTGVIYKDSVVKADDGTPVLKSVKNVNDGVKISWTKVKKAKKYYVYRRRGSGPFQKVKTLSGRTTSWLDGKVSQNKKYTYMIRAVKKNKAGDRSNEKGIVYLKKVGKLVLKSRKKKSVDISWSKRKGATDYEIFFSGKKKMNRGRLLSVSRKANRVRLRGLKRNKTYYFRIRVVKKVGETSFYSSWSEMKKVKIK